MEADFSGWATKAGLRCSDGRTIMPNAFKDQDRVQVPLVWQHNHADPENVLGHAILENRDEGVYAYCFFNGTKKAAHARQLVEHKDIRMMSIWANELIERSKRVLHGAIREVSLVLSGANPGAIIENVTIRHSDGDETLDDEVIIYTGLEIEHSDTGSNMGTTTDKGQAEASPQAVYDSMTDEQKEFFHSMLDEALNADEDDDVETLVHASGDQTVQDVYDSMTDIQKQVLHFMVGQAVEDAQSGSDAAHSNIDSKGSQMGNAVSHNVFDQQGQEKKAGYVLSHSDIQEIVADASKPGNGSLKVAVTEFALAHGIEDIEILFPDAKAITNTPDLLARRAEWVQALLGGVRKSPFSRIKSTWADITVPEARAKGYIKGNMKKEEFFRVARRITTPTTIYKKQKLDRDDMIDITDFDVVAWLKGEMRVMLDEEVARAILVGDGRLVDDEDKINEDCIRPVASDHELYTTTLTVNLLDDNSNIDEVSEAIILNRSALRGTGLPTLFTTETYIARYMLLKDTTGRRIFRNLDEVAAELRVAAIVPVEVLEEYDDIVAVIFNPTDYVVGADRGGEVNMFDDFDIDYNQYKYLIETRASGALVKLRSAMVVKRSAANAVSVAPAAPTFDGTAVHIVDTPNVVYRNADTNAVLTAAGSPYTLAPGATLNVDAEPASSSYYFDDSNHDSWSFTNNS